jgi:hypothetical protein
MQDIARALDTLTILIDANQKRMKLYLSLVKKLDDHGLRPLFVQQAELSKRFIAILSTWRSAYGGFALSSQNEKSGPGWFQLKSLLDLGRRSVLAQCEAQEEEIIKQYKSAIRTPAIPVATLTDIQQQALELEKALGKFRILRERPAAEREVLARL